MKKGKCDCGNIFEVPTESGDTGDLRKKGNYRLIFLGVDVEINMIGHPFSCFDCRRKMSLEYIEKIISPDEDGNAIVNWNKYVSEKYINSVLSKVGIFSGDAEGNWIIMSQKHGCQNPMFNRSVNLYFTSPDDASEFVDVKKMRRCHVLRIDQVFSTNI